MKRTGKELYTVRSSFNDFRVVKKRRFVSGDSDRW